MTKNHLHKGLKFMFWPFVFAILDIEFKVMFLLLLQEAPPHIIDIATRFKDMISRQLLL